MEPSNMDLVQICGVAFAAVLAILSLLAGTISGICRLFPVNAADLPDPRRRGGDPPSGGQGIS